MRIDYFVTAAATQSFSCALSHINHKLIYARGERGKIKYENHITTQRE